MFSEKQISAYRSIRAPEELKERVLSEAEGKKKPLPNLYRYGALAAALVFVIALSFFFHSPTADAVLLLNGSEIAEEARFHDVSPALETRSVPSLVIPFEIRTSKKVTLRASCGLLTADGEEGKEAVEMKKDGSLFWEIPREVSLSDCYLEMEEKSGTTRFLLTFDEAEQNFVVKKVH